MEGIVVFNTCLCRLGGGECLPCVQEAFDSLCARYVLGSVDDLSLHTSNQFIDFLQA
jgi:hypothetical protein